MKSSERANKIYDLFGQINELSSGKSHGTLMLHNFPYVYDTGSEWNKGILDMSEEGNRIVLTASRNGITLFGQEFNIDREPNEVEDE